MTIVRFLYEEMKIFKVSRTVTVRLNMYLFTFLMVFTNDRHFINYVISE